MNLLRFGMKIFTGLFLPVFCLGLFIFATDAFSRAKTEKQSAGASARKIEWSEDLDKKIEKTIQILDAVKEELKDIKESEMIQAAPLQQGVAAKGEKDLSRTIRQRISLMIRLWAKARKVLRTKTGEPQQETGMQEESRLTKDLSARLEETIETMTAVKKELDKIEDYEKGVK